MKKIWLLKNPKEEGENMADTKYNNGRPIEVKELTSQEKLEAIEEWCEGSQELRELLLFCNQNQIETFACCRGHDKGEEGYRYGENADIAFLTDTSKDDFIMKLLASIEEKGINTGIGFIKSFDLNASTNSFVTISSRYRSRDEGFFKAINESCRDLQNGKVVNPNLKNKYEMIKEASVKLLTNHDIRLDNRADFCQAYGMPGYFDKDISIDMEEIMRIGKELHDKGDLGYTNHVEIDTTKVRQIKENFKGIQQIVNKNLFKINTTAIKNIFSNIKNVLNQDKEKSDEPKNKEGDWNVEYE